MEREQNCDPDADHSSTKKSEKRQQTRRRRHRPLPSVPETPREGCFARGRRNTPAGRSPKTWPAQTSCPLQKTRQISRSQRGCWQGTSDVLSEESKNHGDEAKNTQRFSTPEWETRGATESDQHHCSILRSPRRIVLSGQAPIDNDCTFPSGRNRRRP